MKKNEEITIRIGRGTFNDIVIDDESVLVEHCNIVMDNKGCRVVNLHKESKTFVNNEEVYWEADITPDDELRVGNKVVDCVNWKDWYSNWKTGIIISAIDKMAEVEEKKQSAIESLFSTFYVVLYWILAVFTINSLFFSDSLFLKILSSCLFCGYIGFDIYIKILQIKVYKEMDEVDRSTVIKGMVRRFIIALIIFIPLLIKTHKNSQRNQYKKMEIVKYDMYVSNESGHPVSISYIPRGTYSYRVCKIGAYQSDSIGHFSSIASNNRYSNRIMKAMTVMPYSNRTGITVTFDDSISITHVQDSMGNYIPEKHNLLSERSWIKSSSLGGEIVYTITDDDYKEALERHTQEKAANQ